jgi:hypothetical protein
LFGLAGAEILDSVTSLAFSSVAPFDWHGTKDNRKNVPNIQSVNFFIFRKIYL